MKKFVGGQIIRRILRDDVIWYVFRFPQSGLLLVDKYADVDFADATCQAKCMGCIPRHVLLREGSGLSRSLPYGPSPNESGVVLSITIDCRITSIEVRCAHKVTLYHLRDSGALKLLRHELSYTMKLTAAACKELAAKLASSGFG